MYERILLGFGADNMVVALQETKEPRFSRQVLHERAVRLNRERFLRINESVRSQGGRLVILFWPREGYVVDALETDMSAELNSGLQEFGKENGIATYSVQDALQLYPPEELNILNDGHPTPFAHCLVAQKLASIFEELGYPAKRPIHCADAEPARKNAL